MPLGRFNALKGVWVYELHDPEHEVSEQIRQDQPEYFQHFLTPLDYGCVPHNLSDPLISDNTDKIFRRPKLEPAGRILHTHAGTILHSLSEGHTGDEHLSRHSRQHHRMLFEGVGVPVHDLRNFTDIFTTIQGGWEGLHAIHLSRQVHRDVSSGNILLVSNSGTPGQRGVIIDLEYAKQVDDTNTPHDVRTGAETFMATEVACMKHHRLSSLRSSFERTASLQEDTAQHMQQLLARYRKRNQNPRPDLNPISARGSLPPFRHNPLHDMESIWWLCIWTMLYLVPSNVQDKQYLKNYRQVFFSHATKRDFLCKSGIFEGLTMHLSDVTLLVGLMKEWQVGLNKLYATAYEEQDKLSKPLTRIRIDDTTIQVGYELGKLYLEPLKSYAKSISTELVTLSERYRELEKDLLSTTAPSNPESVPSNPESMPFNPGLDYAMPPLKRRRTQADQNADGGVLDHESDVFG